MSGTRSEDSVDPAAVETQAPKSVLQFGHVVSTDIRRCQLQLAVAQLPTSLDQSGPCGFIANPQLTKATGSLKLTNGRFCCSTKNTSLGAAGWCKPGGTEAALYIAYCLAALTGSQREVGRNSLSSWRSWPLPLAPTIRLATSPLLNTNRVGMLMTL